MKKALLVIFLLTCFAAQAQQWSRELGVHYQYANPVGPMGSIIDQGHGLGTYFGLVTPNSRLAVGVDVSFAQYGREKSRQEYLFDDGTIAPMDIIVSNTFVNLMAYSRWYLSTESLARPYVAGKLGYSAFNTSLNIYDPDDFDHCEPVENDRLYKDGTFIAGIGAGVKVDFSTALKKLEKGRWYLDASINVLHGGNVRYMNADAPNYNHHHGATADADVVTAEFLDTRTQIIHEHHVGYLYSSPVQMTELRLGVLLNISR